MNLPTLRAFARAAALLALALSVTTLSACDSSSSGGRTAKSPPASAKKQANDSPDRTGDLADKREAFGLPFPPEILEVHRLPAFVRVGAKMSLDDLEAFFKARLVDYEILRPGPGSLRAIGLREYMPEIYAYRFAGGWNHIVIEYRPARQKPPGQPDGAGAGVADKGDADRVPNVESSRSRAPGMPVMLRTRSGELLAPGARWGEPYMPPEGSPLHQERYKSNWGRPFGQWILQ